MNKVKIITDSCCSISLEDCNKLGIECISLPIIINGEEYNPFEYPIQDKEEFYNKLKEVKKCSTSCANEEIFFEVFEKYLKQDFDVVFMGLSSGLSSSYQNAIKAAQNANEKYGERVFIADTLTGSLGIALSIETAIKMINEGKSAKEIFEKLDKNGLKVLSIFSPSDLQFLTRNGRLSKMSATFGAVLKIVPVMIADAEGKLAIASKCIGRKRAITSICEMTLQNIDPEREQTIFIGHTNQLEEANQIANFLKERTKNKTFKIDYIDYTMGCHCGPGTISVFAEKK